MIKRVGDTLVEVTLAIGIFSMVAVAIVAVMNGGTSGAEKTLETTLTREEVDTQAEAIRFIHSAYISDMDTKSAEYVNLWQDIAGKAITVGSTAYNDAISNFNPTNCEAAYTNNNIKSNMFVINPNKLKTPDEAFISASSSPNTFQSAATYPRLIYGNATNNTNTESLIDNGSTNLYRAEGIYVIAVRDSDSTALVGDNKKVDTDSAYYDFYIRSCWYGSGDETPSSVATVIRLYDPSPLASSTIKTSNKVKIIYNNGSGGAVTSEGNYSQDATPGETITLSPPTIPPRYGWEFQGWFINNKKLFQSGTGNFSVSGISCKNDGTCTYRAADPLTTNKTITITGKWEHLANKINYNAGKGTGPAPTLCYLDEPTCMISKQLPVYSGREFLGYSTQKGTNTIQYTKDQIKNGIIINRPNNDITLYAVYFEDANFANVDWDDYGNASSYCGITKTDTYITLKGNRKRAVNCGVDFGVGKNDTFELSADLDTVGIDTHPTGFVAVSVGPLVAIMTTKYDSASRKDMLFIYYGYLPLNKTLSESDISRATNYTLLKGPEKFSKGSTVNLKIKKNGNSYTMSVNGSEVVIETRENSNGTFNIVNSDGATIASGLNGNLLNNLKVRYTMVHTSHNCSTIFNAKLYNIKMTRIIYSQ